MITNLCPDRGLRRLMVVLCAGLSGAVAVQASATADYSRMPDGTAAHVPLLGKPGQFLESEALSPAGRAARRRDNQPSAVRNKTYQLGDEWGKKPVTEDTLRRASDAFRRAAQATARAGGATSFVLGQFEGRVVMATNHHVFPSADNCLSRKISFAALNIKGHCDHFIGTWEAIDLSLFTLDLDDEDDRERVLAVAANFDFDSSLRLGQELITVGFGIGNNPAQDLVANADSDCKVFSPDDTFRLMPDPDALNPGTYDAWSFANGCDVSHGDSGSAMVDRTSGKPVGIIWTGKIPKLPAVQDSSYLSGLLSRQTDEIWSELSYAVPAQKIREVLGAAVEDGNLEPSDHALVKAVISNDNQL